MSGKMSKQSDSDEHAAPVAEPEQTVEHRPESASDGGKVERGEPASFSHVGDYEIESEIARGGMGVVYRARQKRLNRTVALKMILRGQFASEDEVQRFYQEAEAAARLDHPGIVPVYEIGEHEGHHFFSMKLIEGRSLDRQLPELSKDLRSAIGLLAKVARAVHHAHQRGILHRDIKPENILIEDESGEPLLADLGLARQVEQDANLTKSGVVVGTPAYMSPEQAGGEELTTATDIYSLGAIIYEMLTGRPPFREATPVATLMKVLNDAPATPSSVTARVDRGLEAVCLNCLERDPNKRYTSAAALAEDLERWFEGKPLSVRPPSLGSVLQTWFAQNLRSVAGALLVGSAFGTLTTLFIFYLVMAPSMSRIAQLYDAFPEVPRPFLAREIPFANALNGMDDWVSIVVFLPLGISIGLVNALVVRPQSRPASIAAGLIASFAAVLIGFVGILGWISTIGIAIDPPQKDIRWLAVMALDDRQGKHEEAKRQLLFEYPDLRGLTPQQRATAIANLINAEQVTKVPGAMLAGLLVVVGVFAVPILVGTIVAARLLSEKKGFWHVTFGYLKPLGVLTLFGLMLGLTLLGPLAGSGGYTPPPIYFVWLLITFPVATWGAIVRWTMTGRLLAHTAWIAALVFLGIEFKDKERSMEIASDLVYQSQYAAAAERLERHVRWRAWDTNEQSLLCLVLAQLDDSDRFREHVREFVKQCGTRNYANAHHWAARMSLLRNPTPRDVSLAVELAESATRPSVKDPEHWHRFSLALVRCHEGKPEESLQLSEACLKSSNNYCVACTRVVRVMSMNRLGRFNEEKEELQELNRYVEEHAAEFQLTPGVQWPQVLYYEALRKSAAVDSPD